MKKLFIFDVDGVLLETKTGGFQDILFLLGKEKEAREIQAEYEKRRHLGPWGLEETAALYEGESLEKLKELAKVHVGEHLAFGAEKAAQKLKAAGYEMAAISAGPKFILDELKEILGLDEVFGTELEFKDGVATGKLERKIDRFGKKEILEELIKERGLSKEKVVAIGDSITDLPLAELAGKFIAYQPRDEEVKERADEVINNFEELRVPNE